MNAASKFDSGPLSWIKAEIDLALARATEALTQYAGSNELTHLGLARTHVHQAHGALLMLGLDGVTQVSEALEALLISLEERQLTAAAPVFDAFEVTLAGIRQYLDDLLAGAPHQPLRLLPVYQILATVRGVNNAHAADLFFPDLPAPLAKPGESAREAALASDPEALKALIKRERAQYQKALLAFLKKPEEQAQAQRNLRQAIAAIEAAQACPENQAFWSISLGFIDSLSVPEIAVDARARQLCSQIDGQLRRLLEGSLTVTERLLRDALYFVAQAPAGLTPLVDELQTGFALAALLPAANNGGIAPALALERRYLREALLACQESWEKCCAGKAGSLASFAAALAECNGLLSDLGPTDWKRLGQALAAMTSWLREEPARQSDTVAMEVATAILLLLHVDSHPELSGSDFARLVDLMVARLYACMAGNIVSPPGLPLLDALTRQAQEKLVIAQVARSISNHLVQVEQQLDAYFSDPAKPETLTGVDGPLKQIAGALTMLGHFDAVAELKQCSARIKQFSEPAYLADPADFEGLAGPLARLGFFVEALQHGARSYKDFIATLPGQKASVGTAASTTVPAEVAASGVPEVAPAASPETADVLDQPVPASATDGTGDLLAVFLEEARAVLASLAKQLASLKESPHQTDVLSIIRRGTHTLKGSAHIVGLAEFSDIAWEIEQTLNFCLRREQVVNADLLKLLADEHKLFSLWLVHLESGIGAAPDGLALVQLAQQLRATELEDKAPPLPAAIPDLPPSPPLTVSPELEATADALADLLNMEVTPLSSPVKPENAPLARSTAEIAAIPAKVEAAPTLLDIFRAEARGHLQTLSSGLADLQARPDMPTPFAMCRAAHTLGGTAATVACLPMQHLSLALEDALLRRDASADPAGEQGLAILQQTIAGLECQFLAQGEQQEPEEQPALLQALAAIYLAAPAPAPAEPQLQITEAELPEKLPAAEEVPAFKTPLPEIGQLRDELDAQLLPLFLDEAEDQLGQLRKHLLAWRASPDQPEAPQAIARLLHNLKGNARMAGALNIGEFTHLLEARVAEAAGFKVVLAAVLDEIEAAFDTLAQAVEELRQGQPLDAVVPPEISGASSAPIGPLAADAENTQAGASLRVPAKLLDQLVNEAGELSIARTRIEGEMRSLKSSLLDMTENVSRLRGQLREVEMQAEGQMQAQVEQTSENAADFDPLELDRFTRFQELTRFMAESVNDVATLQQSLLKHVDEANAAILAQSRLNRNLQQELQGMRMLPFASQSERLYRVVRQTAKELDKRANLDIVGGEVEIDRAVLERLMAPLEHMLRNAISHGIENPAQRRDAGKPEAGEISISLAQAGNEIILVMHDDGQGLDAQAIRQRAESLQLLKAEQAIAETALFDFIFQPGFSTASEVSQLAGRGIGMDVLKTEISALGGRVEVDSSPSQGTTFTLYLPQTLAVTPSVLLRTGTNLYAIPAALVEQVLELKEEAFNDLRQKGEAEWMGQHYPCHFLPHLLGETDAVPEVQRLHRVLLLRSGTQRLAVLVDELKGNQELVVKHAGEQLARVVGIDGATVLGDGRIVLMLNPVALAGRLLHTPLQPPDERANLPASGASTAKAAEELAPPLPPVMVIDDSLTVRKILNRLLTREGYQVQLAKDGVEALEQLQGSLPLLVLCDVEMPRMDGFDVIRYIRADARLQALPIIMVTSRTADKHRQHAIELGANHYLGKPYDEAELLRLIDTFATAHRSLEPCRTI